MEQDAILDVLVKIQAGFKPSLNDIDNAVSALNVYQDALELVEDLVNTPLLWAKYFDLTTNYEDQGMICNKCGVTFSASNLGHEQHGVECLINRARGILEAE